MSVAIPVLLYHSVTDDPSPALARYTLGRRLLGEHAAVIAQQGWRVLTIGELTSAIDEGTADLEPTLAITFDDGFADTADHAAPILAEHKLAATLYVTSGTVGRYCDWLGSDGRRPMASWQQLADLGTGGWEIGAHSVDHPELDVLGAEARRSQIHDSRTMLQDNLGLPIDSFAYPHGYHGARVRSEVVKAGYRTACAVKNAMSSATDDPFARARLTITSDTTAEALARLLIDARTGKAPPATASEDRRTTAWRCYRRLRHRATGGPGRRTWP